MKRSLSRFWYRFKNWFRIKPGLGEPLRFVYGSEEELRRVTRWICQAAPSLFTQEILIIHYQATDGKNPCRVTFIGDFALRLTAGEKEYLRQSSALIAEHNRFTGTKWLRDLNTHERQPKTLFGFFEWPTALWVEVVQPSEPEHVNSRLALAKWLDSKIGEKERRALLQLPDDIKV